MEIAIKKKNIKKYFCQNFQAESVVGAAFSGKSKKVLSSKPA